MNREDITKLAKQVQAEGFAPVGIWPEVRRLCELAFAAGVAAERQMVVDSLRKQAELAADDYDRRWALEMAAAVAARGQK